MTVKGSKQDKLKIVTYDPWQRFRRIIYMTLFIAAVAGGCFYGGIYASLDKLQVLTEERDLMQEELVAAEGDVQHWRQRASVLEKGGEVDRQAAEGIRQTVKELKARIATLEEEVSFYKGIMAPNAKDQGLRISKVTIKPLEEPRKYSYSIMMTQVADNSSYIKGLAAINFVGTEAGERKIMPLRELDENVSELGIKFRFRYFQEVTGEVIMPETFNVEQVQVVLQSTGAKAQRVEQTNEWLQ